MIKNLFRNIFPTEKDLVERYLGESVSLIDLEIRQRQIDRNEAPFQKKAYNM